MINLYCIRNLTIDKLVLILFVLFFGCLVWSSETYTFGFFSLFEVQHLLFDKFSQRFIDIYVMLLYFVSDLITLQASQQPPKNN